MDMGEWLSILYEALGLMLLFQFGRSRMELNDIDVHFFRPIGVNFL